MNIIGPKVNPDKRVGYVGTYNKGNFTDLKIVEI